MQISKKFVVGFAFILLLVTIFSFFPIHKHASAKGLWDSQVGMGSSGEIGKSFETTGTPRDIRVILARLIKVFLGFLGIIFMILLVFAGFKWMTAGGNEKNVSDAQAQIRTAIIGLIIIMMAYSIANYVTICIYDVTTQPSPWMCRLSIP